MIELVVSLLSRDMEGHLSEGSPGLHDGQLCLMDEVVAPLELCKACQQPLQSVWLVPSSYLGQVW
jgi:hypothetical protein